MHGFIHFLFHCKCFIDDKLVNFHWMHFDFHCQVANKMESSPRGKNFDRRMTGASVIDEALHEVSLISSNSLCYC